MSSPMTLRCRGCGWSWGPVGVQPVVPGGAQQVFVVCGGCGRPQARTLEPAVALAALGCVACDSTDLRPLDRCPSCDGTGPSWEPFMG